MYRYKPTLRCQAHWRVTQNADTRPKPAKELDYLMHDETLLQQIDK
jgi:hypothetical protein